MTFNAAITKPSVATLVLNHRIIRGPCERIEGLHSLLRGVETLLNGLSQGFELVVRPQLSGLEMFIHTIAPLTDLIRSLLVLINNEGYAPVWRCKTHS